MTFNFHPSSYALQKSKVFGQLNPPEKCFKICYVYGKKKNHVVFFVLHFEQLLFFPNECPGLCRHRHNEMKNEKNYMGFLFP